MSPNCVVLNFAIRFFLSACENTPIKRVDYRRQIIIVIGYIHGSHELAKSLQCPRNRRYTVHLLQLVFLEVLHQNHKLDVRVQVITSCLLKRGHGVRHYREGPCRYFRLKPGKDGIHIVEVLCVVEEALTGIVDGN